MLCGMLNPFDSICLRMPWGLIVNVLVPARNPHVPVFELTPRGERAPREDIAVKVNMVTECKFGLRTINKGGKMATEVVV